MRSTLVNVDGSAKAEAENAAVTSVKAAIKRVRMEMLLFQWLGAGRPRFFAIRFSSTCCETCDDPRTTSNERRAEISASYGFDRRAEISLTAN